MFQFQFWVQSKSVPKVDGQKATSPTLHVLSHPSRQRLYSSAG